MSDSPTNNGVRAKDAALPNRWLIAVAAFFVQLALGAVYGWSVFLRPVQTEFNAAKPEANLTFTITLVALGITAGFGGYLIGRFGVRTVATVGGILYGAGVILSSFAPNLFVLYLCYGVLGGIGIGLGYIVPLAMLIKWFPDKRGLITGLAVAGFGLGAFVTGPLATVLIGSVGLRNTFLYLGIGYLIIVVIGAQFFRAAPENYRPAGWTPTAQQKSAQLTRDFTLGEALRSPKWYVLWLTLALNVTAGADLISVAAPLAQDFTRVDAGTAAILVSVISVFNGVGRLFWGWSSDRIGRPMAFVGIFVVQIFAFLLLSQMTNFWLLLVPAALIGLCYGGGFGTMPAFAADFFGPKNAGTIYGAMLTAWSAGAVVGPILISSLSYQTALFIIAGIMLVSVALPFVAQSLNRRADTGRLSNVPR